MVCCRSATCCAPVGGDYVILNDGGSLRLLSGRFTWEHRKALGMRSIGLASLRAEAFRTEDLGTSAQEVIEATDLPVAAVSLGITEGAVQKAMDYSRVRTTFNVPLKDYEPVAQPLARIVATKDILLQALMSADNPQGGARSEGECPGTHEGGREGGAAGPRGGYGYFRDFGVEKFYRDSAALTAMFSDTRNDMRRLASEVYGERAGFI
ncbi:hypothetical protein [Thermogymnomonas acidicola]|uniref:hypothetical protein n=1 Tax=Thermogymnomonas acidicola TaxID=399579 RepID=UPI001396944B|nr:hypothetical protein [Thermogymnomonas acidicola]